jgi:uncharacterized protein
MIFLVLVIFMLGLIAGSLIFPIKLPFQYFTAERINISERKASTIIPAVDQQGKGVAGILETRIRPGSGAISFDIKNVLNEFDTQNSGRVAAKVAEDYTKIELNNLDITFVMDVNATMVGGPSAGASMAVSIISALQNKSLNKSVMITGTINEGGTIGQVGEIVAKATVAKDNNISLFLVPPGQSVQYEYKKEEKCEYVGKFEYCRINYVPQAVNIGEMFGITVVEVNSVEEALNYFLSK